MTRRGCFAVVVGPDGVGKSTFARELLTLVGDGRYFHFRPPTSGPLPTDVPDSPPQAKHTEAVLRPMGWIRMAVAVPRFWLGYYRSVRPDLRAGRLVLGDRWAYGYLVQPYALRFAGPAWLAYLAVALMPRPDVVFNLAAPADVIRERKAELSVETIRSELAQWGRLPGNVVTLDARKTPHELAVEATEMIGP
jgi:thymidylate kinase